MATDTKMKCDPEIEPEVARMLAAVFMPANRHKLDAYIERIGELLAAAESIRLAGEKPICSGL